MSSLSSDSLLIPQRNSGVPDANTAFGVDIGPPAWLKASAWSLAVIAGFLRCWVERFSVNPDGNNYLDIASAYWQHNWAAAINAWWSPMFSWILSAVAHLTRVKPYWEAPMVHLVNFAGFLISLACFEVFLRTLRKAQSSDENLLDRQSHWLLAYSLFLAASFYVLGLEVTTPDVWVTAVMYLVSALLLWIKRGDAGYRVFAALGFLLAIGYFTKGFFFPLSFVILFTAWRVAGERRRHLKALLATMVFLCVSSPFVVALSRAKHHFTFGETGRMAYFMFASRLPQPSFWQGENNTGIPKHPTRQILTRPRLYEFATPVSGSYPVWYDLSYWLEGAVPQFTVRSHLAIFRQSAGTFYLIWLELSAFSVALLTLVIAAADWRTYLHSLARLWYLWTPSLLGCLAYSLILVEGRYVASFVVVLCIAAFAAIPRENPAVFRRLVLGVALAVCCVTSVRIAKGAVSDFLAIKSRMPSQQNIDWQVAQGLHALGIAPGDQVAGISIMGKAHWARLAEVRIIAEIPLGEEFVFWTAEPALREEVMSTFVNVGAQAVVTEPPLGVDTSGWKQLPNTDYYVYPLSKHP